MNTECKTAPFQRLKPYPEYPSYRITWDAHLKAYEVYAQKYGYSQSAETIAERGGFADGELDMFYPNWKEFIVTNKQELLNYGKKK